MRKRNSVDGLLIITALVLSACAAHGPGGVPYANESNRSTAVGSTSDTGSGSLSGGTPGPLEKEGQRGNTPPGVDRDGHGPAAGAIVDPTGAATGRRPD